MKRKNLFGYFLGTVIFAIALIIARPTFAADEIQGGAHDVEVVQAEGGATAPSNASAEEPGGTVEEPTNQGVLGLLGINWKLFVAQLVNFGIVLFVLWKWVFKPVSSGLEARTAKIEKSLHDATDIEQAKKEFEDWKSGAMSTARSEAAQIVSNAKTEAQVVKKEILDEAKADQEKVIAQARDAIEQEKLQAITDIKTEAADLVVAATQKILGQKLDSAKDKELIKQSLKGL